MSIFLVLFFMSQISNAKLHQKISKGPPVKKEEKLTRVATQGEEVKLVCPVDGFPPPIVEWTKVYNQGVDFLLLAISFGLLDISEHNELVFKQ